MLVRVQTSCSLQEQQSACAEPGFSKNKSRLVGGGGGGWRAAGNCTSSGRRWWRPELGRSKVWKGGVTRKRRGHAAGAQLIGCGSRQWEGPDLRAWRRVASCVCLPIRVRCQVVAANFSLCQLQTEPQQLRRKIAAPPAPSPAGD